MLVLRRPFNRLDDQDPPPALSRQSTKTQLFLYRCKVGSISALSTRGLSRRSLVSNRLIIGCEPKVPRLKAP